MPELNIRIDNDTWCVDKNGNVSRNGTILCGQQGLDDDAATVRDLLHSWREMQRVHHHHCDPVDVSKIGYVMPDYEHPGAYYMYRQPQAFDGTWPQPAWDANGDHYQTVRLPVPEGAEIIDAQPCRDEPGKISVRWRRKACKVAPPEVRVSHCPACDSPNPKLHPAVQWEGEVSICNDKFHTRHPRPELFTWPDAERVMLAGGECESTHPEIPAYYARCRIRDGVRQAFVSGHWTPDSEAHIWEHLDWRPRSAPQQYTWEQAEAGMRRGEIWLGRLPIWAESLQFSSWHAQGTAYHLIQSRVDESDEWTPFTNIAILRECEWRPYSEVE